MTLLEIVKLVDNFTYGLPPEELYKFCSHDGNQELGFIVPMVAQQLGNFPDAFQVDQDLRKVTINGTLDTLEKRNKALAIVARELNESGFIKGWRDELFTIYYPAHEPYALVERALSPLLGIVMYGIHINGYIPPHLSSTGEIQFWIPRRSKTKSTYPGMLDNTIGGGIGHPYGVFETVVKESYEEAGLSAEFIRKNSKAVGTVSYTFCDAETEYDNTIGLVQPEVQYIYDLVCDESVTPRPIDHEAESFHLMSFDEVWENIINGHFKPNCALVIADFLIRHGYITSENEPDYIEILSRLHRLPPFPLR